MILVFVFVSLFKWNRNVSVSIVFCVGREYCVVFFKSIFLNVPSVPEHCHTAHKLSRAQFRNVLQYCNFNAWLW